MLRLMYRNMPVPVHKVVLLRNLAHGQDVCSSRMENGITLGKSLHNSFLAKSLAQKELGRWSLSADTLNFLEQHIRVLKPSFILEFGSGISTACLARYMQEQHGDIDWYVLSIEQEIDFAQATSSLLRELKLEKYAKVVYCPLRRQVIEGMETICYDFPHEVIMILENKHPDLVVIDGPSGEEGVRFGTLPLVLPFLNPGAWFFLDDALRDGELEIAQQWSHLPKVRIDGIYFIGKGLLVGKIDEDAQVCVS